MKHVAAKMNKIVKTIGIELHRRKPLTPIPVEVYCLFEGNY
jgi:hypothetical protein